MIIIFVVVLLLSKDEFENFLKKRNTCFYFFFYEAQHGKPSAHLLVSYFVIRKDKHIYTSTLATV